MINYCTRAMFGGEVITTLVMTLFSAGLLFFLGWVLIDALNNKTNKQKTMNEEQIKKPNYFLAGSLVIGAVILSSAWVYSAKIDARGGVPAGSEASGKSHSAPASAYGQQQPAAQEQAPARRSGGCGV